jgi:hypothetical protein
MKRARKTGQLPCGGVPCGEDPCEQDLNPLSAGIYNQKPAKLLILDNLQKVGEGGVLKLPNTQSPNGHHRRTQMPTPAGGRHPLPAPSPPQTPPLRSSSPRAQAQRQKNCRVRPPTLVRFRSTGRSRIHTKGSGSGHAAPSGRRNRSPPSRTTTAQTSNGQPQGKTCRKPRDGPGRFSACLRCYRVSCSNACLVL